MEAQRELEHHQNKAEARQKIKFLVQKLFQKRLFYDKSNPEWKNVWSQAFNFQKLYNQSKTPHKSADRMITDTFYQCNNPKKNGRPFAINIEQTLNTTALKFIDKLQYKRYRKHKISKRQYRNTHKRINNLIKEINKPTIIKYQIPNYNINDNEINLFNFKSGYKVETLHAIDKDKKYLCYCCDTRIHKLQGKNCMNVNCHNPLIKRRKKQQLQFHDECLLPLNWNDTQVCGCCAYVMWKKQYSFPSGNSFIIDTKEIINYKPISMISINGDNIIFFKGSKSYPDAHEYYFVRYEQELLNYLASPMTATFITWNNMFRIPSMRDQYEYHRMPITGFKNNKYPQLSLQYIQNKFNDYIPTWMAIDNFLPIPEIISEIISVALHDLWDSKANDNKGARKRDIPTIGEYYDNAKLSIVFINYSYKVIVHPTIKSQLKSQPKNKAYKKMLEDEYEIFEIDNNWDHPKYSKLKQMIIQFTNELNELIKYLSKTYPEIMHKYKPIQFKSMDMAAILLYCINQTPHIDTRHVMDLLDPNPSNSSLYMINVTVNSMRIKYNQNTNTFSIEQYKYPLPKIVCLENTGRPCKGGDPKQKHLFAGDNTIVMAIPPDVAMSCHQIHNVSGHTMVLTLRGLSDETKYKAQSIPGLMNRISNLSMNTNHNQ